MEVLMVKNVLFILALVYASYCDVKKMRIIPDKIHVIIIILALIEINWISSILGLLLVPLPFLVVALIKNGSMGGGDIKLVGACSFFLGFYEGGLGTMLGLTFAILTNVVYFRHKVMDYTGRIALVPFLGVGYLYMSFV